MLPPGLRNNDLWQIYEYFLLKDTGVAMTGKMCSKDSDKPLQEEGSIYVGGDPSNTSKQALHQVKQRNSFLDHVW